MQSLNRFRFAKIKMSLPCNWDAMELKSFQFNRGRKCIFSLIALLFILESTSASVCSSIPESIFASTKNSRTFSTLPNDFQYSEILKGKTCVWRIIAPTDNHFIKIWFKYFNLEDNYGSCSSTDGSLEIRDGSSSSSDLINIYCQQNIPELYKGIYSSGRYLYLKLKSNYSQSSSNDTGFSMWYTAISKVTTCSLSHFDVQNGNIILSGSSGTIQSPIPFTSTNKIKCIWRIKLSSNNYIVKISFTSLKLGSSFDSSCPTNNDYLEIFDGYSVSDGVPLGRFCGTKVPPNIYTRGNKLTVVFKSDTFILKKGFSASYSSVSSSGTRGSCTAPYVKNSIYLRNSAGVIASPNYPADYPRYMDCTWKINVPSGKRVKLYFLGTFQLESNCDSFDMFNDDYVQIRDGLSSTSRSLGKFCGSSKPQPVLTSNSSATVQFKTDSGTQHKGFYLVYEVYDKNVPYEGYCYPIPSSTQTFEMTNTSGTIMSPNYPSNYPRNIQCVWKISVRDGKRVKFVMEGWDVDCLVDYVQVRDGYYSYSSELKTYCGYSSCAEPAIYSTDRYMWIKFQSGFHDVSSRGFKAKFSEVEKSGALNKNSAASVGMIVGIVVGVVIFIAIVIAIAFYCYKRNRNTGAVNRSEMVNLS